MSLSINSENLDEEINSCMSNEQYSDMIDNMQILDQYYDISNKLYDQIYNQIASCPNDLLNKLNSNSHIKFWEFILENCIGVKYINHINSIYNFKDKYNNL
jgi:hypothetical protein